MRVNRVIHKIYTSSSQNFNFAQQLIPIHSRIIPTSTPHLCSFSLNSSKRYLGTMSFSSMSSRSSSSNIELDNVQKSPQNSISMPAQLAVQIFKEAVESVKPKNLLEEKFKLRNDSEIAIKLEDGTWKTLDLKQFKKVYVVGFGKAVLPMAEQVMTVLGNKVEKCVVNIPEGFRDPVVDGIDINRGARNNIPDEASFEGTQQIVDLVQSIDYDDLVIVLITGGGSALFSYPLHPITIEEKGALVKTLSRAGATIEELNSIRKRLSLVKGGGLLTLCRSSTILSLVLSDVMNDPMDIIASGPTVVNTDAEFLARDIIQKYTDYSLLPNSIQMVLDNPVVTTPHKNAINIIIGNNTVALETASNTAKRLNLFPYILTKTMSGDAGEVGEQLGNFLHVLSYIFRATKSDQFLSSYNTAALKAGEKLKVNKYKMDELLKHVTDPKIQSEYDGVCVLIGGETTVNVRSDWGVGGRNQELTLSAGMKIDTCANNLYVNGKVALLSAGTDGFDGPCNAAGAVLDCKMLQRGYEKKLSPTQYLDDNNSYEYFRANSGGAYHIITGHTETNVMDLMILLVVK